MHRLVGVEKASAENGRDGCVDKVESAGRHDATDAIRSKTFRFPFESLQLT